MRSAPPAGFHLRLGWGAHLKITTGEMQMIRTVLAVAAVALGASVVTAQQDPIAARKALMKANGDQARIGTQMLKGEAPFDVAKAKAIFTTYQDAAGKMPNLFPDNSKTGGETAASPKIWENKADFTAKFAKFGADAKAAEAAVRDLDTFKAQFPEVQKNCGGCHETYRIRRS
jgi:cytochrome c556